MSHKGALLCGAIAVFSMTTHAAMEEVTIDTAKTGEPISPYIYGQFIEHLGRCIYGGIWAEMLEDRKFFFPIDGEKPGWDMHTGKKISYEGEGVPYEILVASPWQPIGPKSAVTMDKKDPYVGEHTPVIALDGSAGTRGIYHPRLGFVKGKEYSGYIVLKAAPGVKKVDVAILCGEGKDAQSVVTLPALQDSFQKCPLTFTAGGDTTDGRLEIRCYGSGSVSIGTVSLMPADNAEGFRKDTLALLRELNSPIYRWPGGNFVSGYNWRDGVGERDKRPPRKNPAWTGIEHNDVGIHEYMRFCELVNTEPFVSLNTGLGDAASAAAEVQYITGAADTPEGARRAANGCPDPWKAGWWAVGNEMYGNWQLGHMPLEEYVKKHNAVVDAIRQVLPDAKCVGVGAAGPWSKAMLTQCADHMDLLSEHLYWQRKDSVLEHVAVPVEQIQKLADTHRGYRAELPSLKDKNIRVALDEWNYWYGPNLYGEIGVRYFMRDALGVAAAMHTMFRNSDIFFMANYAQTVNVIGAIKTTQTDAFLETTGQVLKLYRKEFGRIPLAVQNGIRGLDIAAASTADGSAITLGAVNANNRDVTFSLKLKGAESPKAARGWIIQNSDSEAYNDETHRDRVGIQEVSADLTSGSITVKPYSITLLRLER
jgi:alpha-N-arabinofuranosidase